MNFLKNLFAKKEENKENQEIDEVEFPPHGNYDLEIVGESHYQSNIESICGERKERGEYFETVANLILEDTNPHDKNAVRIEIQSKPVGYLSKEVAKLYRAILTENKHPKAVGACKALIKGGWKRKNGDIGSYGVWLDIPVEE